MGKILSRLGDGFATFLTEAELMKDLEEGTEDASERGHVPSLSDEEIKYLFESCKAVHKISSVQRGHEVVMTYDGGTNKVPRLGINTGRLQTLQMYERCFGADTTELSDPDYTYRQVKPTLRDDIPMMEQAQLLLVVPVFYGAMPNLGIYTQPDGPMPNPMDLFPAGKIKDAQEAYEGTIELAVRDIVTVASAYFEAGADGINIDTVGASGDPDFKAALLASEELNRKYPDICIEMGMAGEFVLGMHGEINHNGVRLAGLYPHEQVKMAQASGVTIFGPAINTRSSKSIPWNIARAATYTKACVASAEIPVHANMGMGVGALPLCLTPPVDTVSLASKAMVEITDLDGL